MKITSEKYRFVSFILLMVLGFNVIIPATVTAATFFCTPFHFAKMTTPSTKCGVECIGNSQNEITHLSSNRTIAEECTFQRFCHQTITDPLTEMDGLIPAEIKSDQPPAVATIFNADQYTDTSRNKINYISLEATFPYPAPPIFLVNSTFLN